MTERKQQRLFAASVKADETRIRLKGAVEALGDDNELSLGDTVEVRVIGHVIGAGYDLVEEDGQDRLIRRYTVKLDNVKAELANE